MCDEVFGSKVCTFVTFSWLARFPHKSFAKAGRVLNEIYEIILQDECFCHRVAAVESRGTQPNFFEDIMEDTTHVEC